MKIRRVALDIKESNLDKLATPLQCQKDKRGSQGPGNS